MCENCRASADSPAGWNPAIAEALELTRGLYAIHSTGGPLHSVLDDWNIDGLIEPWYGNAEDWDDEVPSGGRTTREICDELAAKLNAMPEADRYSMLAYHDRLIEVPNG